VVSFTAGPFYLLGKNPDTHWTGGLVGPRASLDEVEKRKLLTVPGLELRPLDRPARSQSLYRLDYSMYFSYGEICVGLYYDMGRILGVDHNQRMTDGNAGVVANTAHVLELRPHKNRIIVFCHPTFFLKYRRLERQRNDYYRIITSLASAFT
jgi:hypothetical protein